MDEVTVREKVVGGHDDDGKHDEEKDAGDNCKTNSNAVSPSCLSPASSPPVLTRTLSDDFHRPKPCHQVLVPAKFMGKNKNANDWDPLTEPPPPLSRMQSRWLIGVVGCRLDGFMSTSSNSSGPQRHISRFHSYVPEDSPPISQFLMQFATCVSGESVLAAIAYISLGQIYRQVPVNPMTIHRLLLAALIVAHKTWDDQSFWNCEWEAIAGTGVRELNHLERGFLERIGYRTLCTPSRLLQVLDAMLLSECSCTTDATPDPIIVQSIRQRLVTHHLHVCTPSGYDL